MLTTVRIEAVADGFAIHSPYNPAFVAALKNRIPNTDRKWDANHKVWIVTHSQAATAVDLIASYYNESIALPQATGAPTSSTIQLLDVRYIGAAKQREDGSETSFGWSSGEWSVIFPKAVLLEWFGQTARPGESHTLYGVLGVSQSVDPSELRTAWKRLIRTWHPDISREPGSAEQFRAIQQAYEVLGDKVQRARYDAGLQFEGLTKAHSPDGRDWEVIFAERRSKLDYRAPLRCGLILAEGQSRLGRFVVSKIVQWADLTNSSGEILVTSWGAKDDHFTESWVMP